MKIEIIKVQENGNYEVCVEEHILHVAANRVAAQRWADAAKGVFRAVNTGAEISIGTPC